MPTASLRTDKDAYVAEDAPDAGHGAEATLKVESKVLLTAANKRLLCSFDLRALPATAVRVIAAKLRLVPLSRTRGRTLRCHEVTGTWTEERVTWNTQPGVGRDHGTQGSESDVQQWDVSASVQAAFPHRRAEFRVKDDVEGALLTQRQEYAARERPGPGAELVVTYEEQRHADLRSVLRPRLTAVGDLGATVQVAVRQGSSLGSTLLVAVRRFADLASGLRTRVRGTRGLHSSVQVRAPQSPEVPTPGQRAHPDLLAADDFAAVSAEAGSTIVHGSGAESRPLRRVVHLVDTRELQSFPRALTSEAGQPSTQDQLRRGDAILYALGSDRFRPGDTVTWQGRAWVVAGLLGMEMVGDVKVYQEVGLRRLSVVALGRLIGRVEVSA